MSAPQPSLKRIPATIASYLYTPALLIDSLIAKRNLHDAHALVIDLEDSIHVRMKDAAREKVLCADLSLLGPSGTKLGLRINSIATYAGISDLQLVRKILERGPCPIGVILLPKVNHPSEVKVYRALLKTVPSPPRLFAFIETVEAVENVDGIAAVSDALCFGQADLVAELYSPNEAYLEYARARLCVAAARRNIPTIDTNSFEIEDMNRVESECLAARRAGFTAKAAIHPKHVPIINRVFGVSDEVIREYQNKVDAYLSSPSGFAIKGGDVLAPPFVAKARKMLAFYHHQVRRDPIE